MSVLNYFKNTPGRPPIGRQVLSVIFFLQIYNDVPGKKRGLSPLQRATGCCRPPSGDQCVGPPTGAAGACRPVRGRQGGLSPPPSGDRGIPTYIRSNPPSLLISARKFQQKSRKKKRDVRKREAAKPCRIQHL